jgi:hypothetical protein
MDFYPVTVVIKLDTTHNNAQITQKIYNAQTKHSTQSYSNNKGHIAQNEYDAKKERKKVKLSP